MRQTTVAPISWTNLCTSVLDTLHSRPLRFVNATHSLSTIVHYSVNPLIIGTININRSTIFTSLTLMTNVYMPTMCISLMTKINADYQLAELDWLSIKSRCIDLKLNLLNNYQPSPIEAKNYRNCIWKDGIFANLRFSSGEKKSRTVFIVEFKVRLIAAGKIQENFF